MCSIKTLSLSLLFFLSFILTANTHTSYHPRKLTISEVKNNPKLQLEKLLTPSDKTKEHLTMSDPAVPLSHLPKGTNLGAGPKDSIRMPGTNWCGKGWRADSAKSMGGYAGADRCCRHHDLGCPISIEPGQTRFGLTNPRIHTVMHCSCDERFRSCLKMARTQAADIVGNLFFNLADIPCFVFSKAQVCSARNWWGHCTEKQEEQKAVWRKPLPYKS